MAELILLILAFILVSLLITLLLCHLTRNRLKFLRLLPLLGTAVMWFLAWQDYNSSAWFSDLAAFAEFIGGLLILAGWVVALILVFLKRRKAKCQKEENSGS